MTAAAWQSLPAKAVRKVTSKVRALFNTRYLAEHCSRVVPILRTPYRVLLLDDRLNFRLDAFPVPALNVIQQNSRWTLFEIAGIRFYWPSEYQIELELRWLYHEINAPHWCNAHTYEHKAVAVRPGDWVIYAGACEVFFAHYALARGANVLVIEPVPILAQALHMTFAQEIDQDRVRVLLEGDLGQLSARTGLSIPDREIYSVTLSVVGTETVKVYTVDDVIQDRVMPRVDFLKMDIEGGEVEAIAGERRTLQQMMPRVSLAVYHDYRNAMLLKTMIRKAVPAYEVKLRGLFIRDSYGPPRPHMLYAAA